MKAFLQRVAQASVSVEGKVVGSIGPGLVIFIGVENGDSEVEAKYLVNKAAGLRIFSDQAGKFNLSVQDVLGEILVISQFTLLADTRKGKRPNFINAAPPDIAEPLCDIFIQMLQSFNLKVESGQFQKHMLVEIHNDGPVSLMLNSPA